jgi:hypothetical protein
VEYFVYWMTQICCPATYTTYPVFSSAYHLISDSIFEVVGERDPRFEYAALQAARGLYHIGSLTGTSISRKVMQEMHQKLAKPKTHTGRRPGFHMSAAAKKRISASMRKRWREAKKKKSNRLLPISQPKQSGVTLQ